MKRLILITCALLFASLVHAAGQPICWQDNSSGLGQEEGFIVERHLARIVAGQIKTELDPADTWGEIARVPADTACYTDTITQHRCYRVAAFTVAGMSDYSNVDCTSVMIPTAPTTMELGPLSFSLRLGWGGQEVVLESQP